MRCWSPFPESLLRLPRRMNSCGENRPVSWRGPANLSQHGDSAPWEMLPHTVGPFPPQIIAMVAPTEGCALPSLSSSPQATCKVGLPLAPPPEQKLVVRGTLAWAAGLAPTWACDCALNPQALWASGCEEVTRTSDGYKVATGDQEDRSALRKNCK